MNFIRAALLTSVCLFACSCLQYIQHNEDMAATEAVKFARLAFIERNYEGARKLLPPEIDQQFNAVKLKEFVENMHPVHFPVVVTATEYAPLPGTKSMEIFLTGENSDERIYYRFTLGGTSGSGYKIYALYSSMKPYSTFRLKRPLPIKRSTND